MNCIGAAAGTKAGRIVILKVQAQHLCSKRSLLGNHLQKSLQRFSLAAGRTTQGLAQQLANDSPVAGQERPFAVVLFECQLFGIDSEQV